MKQHIISGICLFLSLNGAFVMADAGHQQGKLLHGMMSETPPAGGQASGTHWMAPENAQNFKNPVPKNEESLSKGQQLFQKNCVLCHGITGKGDGSGGAGLNPQPANLAAMAGMHPDGDVFWKISNGRGPMPAWQSLFSEEERWYLVNYVQQLK